jgi:hypothetical protein
VWQGAVKVFAFDQHPSGASRAYARSYPRRGNAPEVLGRYSACRPWTGRS